MCESCQRRYEPARVKGKQKTAMIKRMKSIRDSTKLDSLTDGLFDELSAPSKQICVKMGTCTFNNVRRPFSETFHYRQTEVPSFLEFTKADGSIMVNGLYKDENGKKLIEFGAGRIKLHTVDFWDIERKQCYLKIYSRTKKVWLELKQDDNQAILISGQLYVGGQYMSLAQAGLKFGVATFRNSTFSGGGSFVGLYIQMPPVANANNPIGHITPAIF